MFRYIIFKSLQTTKDSPLYRCSRRCHDGKIKSAIFGTALGFAGPINIT